MQDTAEDHTYCEARLMNRESTERFTAMLMKHHGEKGLNYKPPLPAPPKPEEIRPPAKSIWFSFVDDMPLTQARPLVQEIKRLVCEYFDIRHDVMMSETRETGICRPRQYGMYLAHEYSGRSYGYISKHFGRGDHTTSRTACKRIQALCLADWRIAYDVAKLQAILMEQFQCEP